MPDDERLGRHYISSARVLAFLLLLLTIWAATEAPHHRAGDIFKARKHFANLVMLKHLKEKRTARAEERSFFIPIPQKEDIVYRLEAIDGQPKLLELHVKGGTRPHWVMRVPRKRRIGWSVDVAALVKIADQWRIQVPPEEDLLPGHPSFGPVADLYDDLESHLLTSRTVKVPTIDYRVDSDRIVVVIAIAVLLVLLAIQSRLRWLVERGAQGRGEPWIILDAEGGLEYAVGLAWLLLLFGSPVIVATSLVMFQSVQIIANVDATADWVNVLWVAFTLAFLIVGCSVSAKTIALLLRLRRLRLRSEIQAE